jgi:AraC-like DNA-binding protein
MAANALCMGATSMGVFAPRPSAEPRPPRQAALAPSPTATGGIARLAATRALETGIDLDPLLLQADLNAVEIEDASVRISVEKQVTWLNLVAAALGDDLLGLHLAEDFDLRLVGLLYYVQASAPTLGDALARAERYSTITNEGLVVKCIPGDPLRVLLTYAGVPRHADRHQIEFFAMTLVRIARQLTGFNLRPVRLSFVHARGAVSSALEDAFRCQITFEQPHDQLVFASDVEKLPILGADPYLHDVLVAYCEHALAHRNRPTEALRTRVENAITPLLPHGRARIEVVARALNMSQRTLARRLASEGLSFTTVLDTMRTDLATQYLRDANLPVSKVAWLLGFQEVSAFTHALKRWSGQTPTQLRSTLL